MTQTSELIEVLQDALKASQLETKRLRQDNYILNEKLNRNLSSYDEVFLYATHPVILKPGLTATASFKVTGADFYATKINYEGSSLAFEIIDSSERSWSNLQIPADNIMAPGLSLIMPKPKLISKNSVVTVVFTDLRGQEGYPDEDSSPQRASLIFTGYQRFDK